MMQQIIPIKKAAKFILGPYLTLKLVVPVHFQSYFRCEIFIKSNAQLVWLDDHLKSLPKALRRIRSRAKDEVLENNDFGLDGELSRILNQIGWEQDTLSKMTANKPSLIVLD